MNVYVTGRRCGDRRKQGPTGPLSKGLLKFKKTVLKSLDEKDSV